MTTFDERERAFENLFAHEEEMRFLAIARRNQLFACWAAEHLGLRGEKYRSYVHSFVHYAVHPQPNGVLIDRVRADFNAEGVEISDHRLWAAFWDAATEAARHARTEARKPAAEPA